jgi:DNA-binding transcriptional MerR regulator
VKTKKKNPNPPTLSAFTTQQVAAITGATLRSIQWWSERHVLKNHGHGHRRWFDSLELIRAFVCHRLRERKVSLATIRAILRRLGPAVAGREQKILFEGESIVLMFGARHGANDSWVLNGSCVPMPAAELVKAATKVKGPVVACDLGELPARVSAGLARVEQSQKRQYERAWA